MRDEGGFRWVMNLFRAGCEAGGDGLLVGSGPAWEGALAVRQGGCGVGVHAFSVRAARLRR